MTITDIEKLLSTLPKKKEKKERPYPGFCAGVWETRRRYLQILDGLLIPSEEIPETVKFS